MQFMAIPVCQQTTTIDGRCNKASEMKSPVTFRNHSRFITLMKSHWSSFSFNVENITLGHWGTLTCAHNIKQGPYYFWNDFSFSFLIKQHILPKNEMSLYEPFGLFCSRVYHVFDIQELCTIRIQNTKWH